MLNYQRIHPCTSPLITSLQGFIPFLHGSLGPTTHRSRLTTTRRLSEYLSRGTKTSPMSPNLSHSRKTRCESSTNVNSECLAVAIQLRLLRHGLAMTQSETTHKHTPGHASLENVQSFAHKTSQTSFIWIGTPFHLRVSKIINSLSALPYILGTLP